MSSKSNVTINTFWVKLEKCAKNYSNASSLHGLRYIAAHGNSKFERIFWAALCLSCTIMTVIMINLMWNRFYESPTSTTIESTNHPINEVEFPAITICNLNKIMASSAAKMTEKFTSHGINESVFKNFLQKLPQIYAARPLNLDEEEETIKNISEVMEKLGYDLETLLFELSQPCEKLLVRCLWLGDDRNCSDMFQNLKTPEGFCCTFNWRGHPFDQYSNLSIRSDFNVTTPAKREPLYVNEASTSSSGLTVVINSEEFDYFSSIDSFFGVSVLLHEPTQYPDIYVPKAFIQPKYEVMIRLRVNVMESSPNVRSLSPMQRKCFFSDEIPLEMEDNYSYEACTLQYKIQGYFRNCNCIPFYYPNRKKMRTCGLQDRQCLIDSKSIGNADAQFKDKNWTIGCSTHCLQACNSVRYDWLVQGNKIYYNEYASPIFENDFNNKSVFNVFFEDNVCIKYRTESLMTWESLIASFGGIFGLCLGGSVVSLIEIIYHFTYVFVKDNLKERRQEKNMIFIENGSNYKWELNSSIQKISPNNFHIGKPFYTNSTLPWIE